MKFIAPAFIALLLSFPVTAGYSYSSSDTESLDPQFLITMHEAINEE